MSSKNITNLNIGGRQFNVDDLLKAAQEEQPLQEEEVVDQEDITTEEDVRQVVDEAVMSHKEEWYRDLRFNKVSLKEAERILDTIMQKGFYEESYRLAGRVFKLRTRTTVDSDRLIEMLRELSPESEAVATHLIARVNAACSLSQFGENVFPHSSPTDENRELLDQEWRMRWVYISSLPQPVFLALAQTMQRFDLKVNLSCDARALENF